MGLVFLFYFNKQCCTWFVLKAAVSGLWIRDNLMDCNIKEGEQFDNKSLQPIRTVC